MKKPKSVYVLGTGLSHDGSACLLKDGKIAVAIEKERITRRKHDGWNDNDAIQYCLSAENITWNDVSLIVQCGESPLYVKDFHHLNEGLYKGRTINNLPVNVPVVNLSHHLAHAYNAIGTSPFEEMAVLVIDGSGQTMKHCMDLSGRIMPADVPEALQHLYVEKESFYEYKAGRLQTHFKSFSPYSDRALNLSMVSNNLCHSIGELYENASLYCLGSGGETPIGLAGKLMGLAPYGVPGVYTREIFRCADGDVYVNFDWQKEFNRPNKGYSDFKANFQYYADIAYWVQKETERAILYIVNERARLCDSRNLAYTGGVALNAVANAVIRKQSAFNQLYLTPAAGDNGLSIGCAYYGWFEVLKRERVMHDGNSCFGKVYPNASVKQAIDSFHDISKINVPQVVDVFFEHLPGCLKQGASGQPFSLQFIVKGCGVYLLEQKHAGPVVVQGPPVADAEGTILVEGRDFIDWMMNPFWFRILMRNNKLHLEGNVAKFEQFFDLSKIRAAMNECIGNVSDTFPRLTYTYETDIVSTTARLLAAGKVIGWFQEGSEFGPRALGHRSILADPRRKDIQQFINARVKFREDFRPFAPSVLLEDVSTYFQYEGESPYMIMIAQVQPEWKDKIPGVVHKDNSCRIQTVTPGWNKRYYELLQAFKKESGIGVLLNTSFNRRSMPIVETPEHALRFFFECDLDYLVMGDYIVGKNSDALMSYQSQANAEQSN